MNRCRNRRWPLLLLALLVSSPALAQEVSLKTDRTRVDFDDGLVLEMRIEGDIDEVDQPPFPGFEIVGRSQSSQFSMINGRTTQSLVYTFSLAPQKAGRFTIGPVRGSKDGKVVARSNAVEVTVVEEQREPMSPEVARDLERRAGESFFLAPVWPQRPVYVGEPFVLEMSLFARRDVNLRVSGWKREADLSAFSAEALPIEQRRRPRQERIGRYTYAVYPQSRHLVVPLEPGRLRVGGATLELVSGDFFDRRSYKAKTPPFEVEVKPLPTKGRPVGFQEGNVGRFDLSVEVRPAEVKAGERVVLTARVSGEGSLETVRAPLLPAIPGTEVEPLEAGDADEIETSATGITGTRVFQWILVPEEEGTLTIPPLRFVSFDPKRGRYDTTETKPLHVEVAGQALLAEAPPGRALREAVTSELRDIRTESDLASHRSGPWHAAPWFLWALAVPGALLILLELGHLLRRRRVHNADRIRSRRARSVAGKQLKTARDLAAAGQTADCFAEVARVLERFVTDRFGFSPRGLTHDALRERLAGLGAEAGLADALVAEWENCDFARFAPVSMRAEEMDASLERAADLITRLDRLGDRGAV